MMGVTFLAAILAGLVLGAVPGLAGIIAAVTRSVKLKRPVLLLVYAGAAFLAEIVFYLLAFLIFDCVGGNPMSAPEELRSCFTMYIYLGASPGVSLLTALPVLFFKRFRRSDSESGICRE